MRELRPLHLPKLVASRQIVERSGDESSLADRRAADNVRQVSLTSMKCSHSPTPTSPTCTVSRLPSPTVPSGFTTSSLFESSENPNSGLGRPLPRLLEDSAELRPSHHDVPLTQLLTDDVDQDLSATVAERARQVITTERSLCSTVQGSRMDAFCDWEFDEGFDFGFRCNKRQKSNDVPFAVSAFSNGDERSHMSAARPGHHKNDSKISNGGLNIYATTSRPESIRTSSQSSLSEVVDTVDCGCYRTHSGPYASCPSSPIVFAWQPPPKDPIDREQLSSTPLLPPLVSEAANAGPQRISPLHSPKVAQAPQSPSLHSLSLASPSLRGASPVVSAKPSLASITRSGMTTAGRNLPLFMLADPGDKWSRELGHANFTILPEPYLPDQNVPSAHRQLLRDWEQAQINWSVHQQRTLAEYGQNSRTFRLTEQKWSEINAQWTANVELIRDHLAAIARSIKSSPASSPTSPAGRFPIISASHDAVPFPEIDFTKLGPMVQVAPRDTSMRSNLTSPKSRPTFFKLLTPSALLARYRR